MNTPSSSRHLPSIHDSVDYNNPVIVDSGLVKFYLGHLRFV